MKRYIKQYKPWHKLLVCVAPFLGGVILILIARYVSENFTLPPCPSHMILGINCPGCGMTRSVTALVNGDVLLSLRQNAMLILLIIIIAVFYLEFVLNVFGFKVRFPIHSQKLLYIILIICGIYSVLRNFVPFLMPI